MANRTIVPFGPQHPVLPEPIHLDLVLEDEKVVEAIPSIGPEDDLGLFGVIDHVQHGFQARHSGNVQIAGTDIRVHARGCGVDDDLRPAVDSFLVGELTLGGVGLPADGV